MTDQELKDLVASLAISMDKMRDSQKQLNKQLGEINNKWGSFAEGMAYPSMEKILFNHFKVDTILPNLKSRKNGKVFEIDVCGYANSTVNTVVLVEIKSHLKEEGIEQLLNALQEFPTFFPEHRNKKLYGMITCVNAPENLRNRMKKEGLFLATMNDETFKLRPSKSFVAKNFAPQQD
jgi:hypothetical protein